MIRNEKRTHNLRYTKKLKMKVNIWEFGQEGHLGEQIQWHENNVFTFQQEFTWQKY